MPRQGAGRSANAPELDPKPLIPKPKTHGRMVPIEQIAPCPQNLRGDDLWEDPEERDRLIASLKRKGLIHALVVVDLEEYLKHYPGDKEEFEPTHLYVVAAGHCRLDAAPDAGMSELRVDVQNDYASDMDAIFMDENLNRSNLTCFQEGEGYRRLRVKRNMSDQQIADHFGFGKSKSRVPKRIAILPLAEIPEARESILSREKGTLTPDKAYNIITAVEDPHLVMPAFHIMQGEGLDVRQAARRVHLDTEPGTEGRDIPHQSQVDDESPASEENEAEGASGSADGAPGSTEAPSSDRTGADPVSSAQDEAGDTKTAAKPSRSVGSQGQKQSKGSKPGNAASAGSARDRAVADTRREALCRDLVRGYAEPASDSQTVRTALTALSMVSNLAVRLAHEWLSDGEHNSHPASQYTADSYRDHVLAGNDPSFILPFAYACVLAEDELRAQDGRRLRRGRPEARVIRHWKHLVEAGEYEPSAWERGFLG